MEQSPGDTCSVTKDIHELKSDVAEIKMDLREVRTTLQVMLVMMAALTKCFETKCLESNAKIVVAGGHGSRSAEIFDMRTRTWRPLPKMTEYRDEARSVLYEGRMFVTGGIDNNFRTHDSVEELNLALQGRWVNSQFQLPRPFAVQACVVYQNRLFVIGGRDFDRDYNTIYEIQMTASYASRLLATSPKPMLPRCTFSE